MMKVTLLGTGGTMPLKNRWLASCLISSDGHSVLIDCGEGTQIALKEASQKCKPIDTVCITHFHADHISGLPGMLLTMCNEGRVDPVTMIGPPGLAQVVKSLCIIAPNLTFPIVFMEYPVTGGIITGDMVITPFLAEHKVTCLGYTVYLRRTGKFDTDKAVRNNVPMKVWGLLQKQDSALCDGIEYTSDMVIGHPRKGIKVTYCTDTRPVKSIVSNARNSDLFICEGMFGEDDKLSRAKETGHMMICEAAKLAHDSDVKRMWLTHYSPSVTEPEIYLDSAAKIFPYVECGYDGKNVELRFENDTDIEK